MAGFMDEEFLLNTPQASKLYHEFAEALPIIDFHNHLSAREIYEDRAYENLTQVWLGGDHYKWRLMRSCGISEMYITGNASDREKYDHWAEALEKAFGNPLYHWTHLELKRYFGIHEPLTMESKDRIWDLCSAQLQGGLTVRKMLTMQNVEMLCTTNDPLEDLKYHRLLRDERNSGGEFQVKVLPTFRPDQALNMNHPDFAGYIHRLFRINGDDGVPCVKSVLRALEARLDAFCDLGCPVSDHSLENGVYISCTEPEADAVLKKKLEGDILTGSEILKYQSYMLCKLSEMYAARHMVMQLHIGALRNNSSAGFRVLGTDAGFDSMNDAAYAPELAALLDHMKSRGHLPKMIIYPLNPKDYPMIASMALNFNHDACIKGQVQPGAAWWFNDHQGGITKQLTEFARSATLDSFVGMLTDSRSFLSFPRHEYFRRILCGLLGQWMAAGEIPEDYAKVGQVVTDICRDNGARYFSREN